MEVLFLSLNRYFSKRSTDSKFFCIVWNSSYNLTTQTLDKDNFVTTGNQNVHGQVKI